MWWSGNRLERATSVATILGVVFGVIALWLSYWTFERQTYIQANQAAHDATQGHIRLRVEHSEIIRVESEIRRSQGSFAERIDELDQAERSLYVTIAEDGIAMAEYVYKLWIGDPGWEDTVESWIKNYRPYLLGVGLDCGDWDPKFVHFISEKLSTSSEDFCFDERANLGSLSLVILVIAAAIIALFILRKFLARRV